MTPRELKWTSPVSAVITYRRDVADRVVERDSTVGSTTTITRYLFAGSGSWGTTDGTGGTLIRDVTLPGGATAIMGSGGVTWSYPNLHGDVILEADNTGTRSGAVAAYDPFGQPIDPTTGNIGTSTADSDVLNTSGGTGADQAWVGAAQKLFDHTSTIATIEMGARQYVPGLGRFLSVDPITGGNSNDYNYPNDPINGNDLSGNWSWGDTWAVVGIVALVAVSIVLTVSVVGSAGDVATGAGIAALGADIAADGAVDAGAEAAGEGVAQEAEAAEAAAPKIHGNSLNSPRLTRLYQIVERRGGSEVNVKYGVTSRANPLSRYSKSFMEGRQMRILNEGSRRDMLGLERNLVERDPGYLNHEPWAGRLR